jgi:YD repeat-containing protein
MIKIFSKKTAVVTFLFIILFLPSLLFALDELYDAPGIDPHRETLSSIPQEHIDPFTGGLTLSHVDISLPGNGGLDLVIQRTFNSKNVCSGWTCMGASCGCTQGENTWMGYGWTLHFGRLYRSNNINGPQVIEMPDGSMHSAYTKLYTTFITKDYWLYDDNAMTVTLTNGTKIYYGHTGGPSKLSGYILYDATKIVDANGNAINIYYTASGSDIISYVTDSVGRQINFTTQTINGATRLTAISGPGVSIRYTHQALTTMYQTVLTQANLPVGNPWKYTYGSGAANSSGNSTSNLELGSVITPYGGTISYSYGFPLVNVSGNSLQYRAVTQKSTSGSDITGGTWNISYSQGTNQEYTNVSDPCNRTIQYQYYGYGSYLGNGSMWEIGLPKSKTIVGEETINYTWAQSPYISSSQYILPVGTDSYIYVPLLSTNAITRDGQTYTTNYSNYDSYGNPKTISESGDKTRTTSKTYWYNTSKNIVQNKPSSETVSGGFPGSFTTNYTYDPNTGNLTQINKYGIITNYSYYANGNPYSMTDANSKITYSQWSNGKLSQIKTPEYTINRTINDNGTVANATDGRTDPGNHITYFTYDGNLRIKSITPPAGNVTSFDYATDNSYKKESRGTFYTYYYFDGFGRPSGTSDIKGIITYIAYKSCGLKDYSTSNIGDTTYYDDFERISEVLHQDDTHISYAYSGSNVTVTDENQKATSFINNSFGNPDEKLLVTVLDALSNTTSYSYNILGSLTGVSQGSISRTFSYNLKNFLSSETHPEKGTITYGRDNVGNMSSKTDYLGTKTYIYDGVNRLKTISYGSENISFTYDGASNRTSMNNPSASIGYSYDPANRLTQKNEVISGKSYATSYNYDGNDNMTDIYYPTGRHAVYTYNSNNQVTSVTGFGSTITGITYYTSGSFIGLPQSFTYANGPTVTLTYNNRNLTTQITAGSSIVNLGYGYDDNRGNMTLMSDYLNSSRSQTFSYDNINRLSTFNGSWGTGSYTYNTAGNRLSKTVAGTSTKYNYSNNRLISTTGGEASSFSYNTNGDTTTLNGYTLIYDGLHNLLSYNQGGSPVAQFTYDGDGMRSTKTAGGNMVVYHYDKESKVISENDASGSLIADYVYLNGKLAAKVTNDALLTPNTPTNLTAVVASLTQINLSWIDNATNETGFKIERKIGTGGTYSQIATLGVNVTTYLDTGLKAGTTYYYRVRAYNGAGDSGYSNEAGSTTSATYTIWGNVTSGGSGLSGMTMTLSGASLGTTTTDSLGNYIFSSLTNGGFTVTPSNAEYTFSPAYISATISGANITGQNFTATYTACSNLPVRIAGATPVYYSSLQAAYNAAVSGDTIQSRADITFTESISINRNISVTLQGGYDCGYVTNSGKVSYLKGMIQTFLGGGTLTISNFSLIQ